MPLSTKKKVFFLIKTFYKLIYCDDCCDNDNCWLQMNAFTDLWLLVSNGPRHVGVLFNRSWMSFDTDTDCLQRSYRGVFCCPNRHMHLWGLSSGNKFDKTLPLLVFQCMSAKWNWNLFLLCLFHLVQVPCDTRTKVTGTSPVDLALLL